MRCLTAGVRGVVGGGHGHFLWVFFACFLSNLGDILDLFSAVALCCSCPSRSAVFVT